MLRGCVEPVLAPRIQAATRRLLARAGYEVLEIPGEGCCGSLEHHMGKEEAGRASARRTIDAWWPAIEAGTVAAILVTASGCGSTVKDYGFMLREDPAYADRALKVSGMALDVSEFLDQVGLPPTTPGPRPRVAYHPACSLQHGQKVTQAPLRLLRAAGFEVKLPADAHLCCGSAGTYNILQPAIAGELGDRKTASLETLDCGVIATGNIGCATQIGIRTATPVAHTVELLDWATGGPAPAGLGE